MCAKQAWLFEQSLVNLQQVAADPAVDDVLGAVRAPHAAQLRLRIQRLRALHKSLDEGGYVGTWFRRGELRLLGSVKYILGCMRCSLSVAQARTPKTFGQHNDITAKQS